VGRVDAAVSAGLQAAALPRGPVRAVRIEETARAWLGRKERDCTLLLAGDGLRWMVESQGQADRSFQTWVHESLHARQLHSVRAASEYRAHTGYEEGMVEGLARLVLSQMARMPLLGGEFEYYVQGYQALAVATGVDVERIWRALWQYPPGAVRAEFPDVVASLAAGRGQARWESPRRRRLQAMADQIFGSSRARARPDTGILRTMWEAALR
jgi:hypothetical protein